MAEAEGEAALSTHLLAEQAVQPSGLDQPAVSLQAVRSLQSAGTDELPAVDAEAGTAAGCCVLVCHLACNSG